MYACSAVHSALLVGLLKANITGLSLSLVISRMNSSLKAPAAAEAPRSVLKLHCTERYDIQVFDI